MKNCFFCDQRYSDQLISLEQLKREYDEQIMDGSINATEVSFEHYLSNCMETQGGTLSFVK